MTNIIYLPAIGHDHNTFISSHKNSTKLHRINQGVELTQVSLHWQSDLYVHALRFCGFVGFNGYVFTVINVREPLRRGDKRIALAFSLSTTNIQNTMTKLSSCPQHCRDTLDVFAGLFIKLLTWKYDRYKKVEGHLPMAWLTGFKGLLHYLNMHKSKQYQALQRLGIMST